MAATPVLLLRSSNRNFPLDLAPELAKAGIPCASLDGLDEYISTPLRFRPFLGVFEVGSIQDLERALLAYEWSEQMQPLAPARYVLLIASKNLPLGDRAKRFGVTEIAVLPQPSRNLLFKLELQIKLLGRKAAPRASEAEGFVAQLEQVEEGAGGRKRVLVLRGQSQKSGKWRNEGGTPQGKIRWRWVRHPRPGEAPKEERYRWEAESSAEPVFEEGKAAWLLADEEADLRCYRENEEIFSARKAAARQREMSEGEGAAREKEGQPPPAAEGASPRERKEWLKGGPEARPVATPEEAVHGEKEASASEAQPAELRQGKMGARAEEGVSASPEKMKEPEQGKLAASPGGKGAREEPAAPAAGPEPEKPEEAAARAAETKKKDQSAREEPPFLEKRARLEMPAPEAAEDSGAEAKAEGGLDSIPSVRSEAENLESAGRSEAFISMREAESPRDLDRDSPWSSKLGETEAQLPPQEKRRERATEAQPQLEQLQLRARGAAEETLAPGQMARPDGGEILQRRARKEYEDAGALPCLGREKPVAQEAALPDKPRPAPKPAETLPDPEAAARAPSEALAPQDSPTAGEEGARGAPAAKSVVPGDPRLEPERERLAVPELRRDSGQERGVIPGAASLPDEEARLKRAARPEAESAAEGERYLRTRHFVTMSLSELNDKDSSWHPIQHYRIYLSAQHRYFGLKHPREVLPLWVYEGELAPEFLDGLDAWKFYDRPPVALSTLEALPIEVTEYLYKLVGLPLPENLLPKKIEEDFQGPSLAQEGPSVAEGGARNTHAPAPKRRFWGTVLELIKKVFRPGGG